MSKHSPRFLSIVESIKSQVKCCSINDVKAALDGDDNLLLIDVREDHEWSQGHLPKAQHLGKGIIERDIELLVPDITSKIVLYCGGGFRSALAADSLQKMGYSNVVSMDGGFRAWKDAGFDLMGNNSK